MEFESRTINRTAPTANDEAILKWLEDNKP